MSRFINADVFEVFGYTSQDGTFDDGVKFVLEKIDEQPTVDVIEVLHGEWFPIDVGDCCYRCSVCNFVRDAYLLEEGNYCPHCGARMDL